MDGYVDFHNCFAIESVFVCGVCFDHHLIFKVAGVKMNIKSQRTLNYTQKKKMHPDIFLPARASEQGNVIGLVSVYNIAYYTSKSGICNS